MTARSLCFPTSPGAVSAPRPGASKRGGLIADMIGFALKWGGFDGDEYIFPEFGMQPEVFYRRLLAVLVGRSEPTLEPGKRNDLIALCRSKICV